MCRLNSYCRDSILLTLLSFFLVSVNAQISKQRLAPLLDPGSTLISRQGNWSTEKTPSGQYITKIYYGQNLQLTHKISFKSKKMKVKHGDYELRWDDGTLRTKGTYFKNKKTGYWVENSTSSNDFSSSGSYTSGLRTGLWQYYRKDSTLYKSEEYDQGILNGYSILYDSNGVDTTCFSIYSQGGLIESSCGTTTKILAQMPRFKGCENQGLAAAQLDKCAQEKLLQYVYANVKYPVKDRELGISGLALAVFIVTKEGTIRDIQVKNGVSPRIKKEVFRLIQNMPVWTPGMYDGEAVDVEYTLPVRFRLQ